MNSSLGRKSPLGRLVASVVAAESPGADASAADCSPSGPAVRVAAAAG
jgi:hypothetical protein